MRAWNGSPGLLLANVRFSSFDLTILALLTTFFCRLSALYGGMPPPSLALTHIPLAVVASLIPGGGHPKLVNHGLPALRVCG